MALQGKFIINNADYSPLSFPGLGTFLAFSGNGAYRNHGGCGAIAKEGPIPAGRYWVVQRGEGGFWSKKSPHQKIFGTKNSTEQNLNILNGSRFIAMTLPLMTTPGLML